MKEIRIPKLNVDPVGKRLERIVAEKKSANEEALCKIKFLTDSWEELHKPIEVDFKDECELMDLDVKSLEEALGDLEENRTNRVGDAFTIAGKVQSKGEEVGLPNLTVSVLLVGKNTKPLKKVTNTNVLGDFVFRLGADIIGEDNNIKLEQGICKHDEICVEYRVFAGDEMLLSEEQSLAPYLGGIKQVMLEVANTDEVSNQREAGKAVRDSIVSMLDLITSRAENMRSAHDAFVKMNAITKDKLNALKEALAVAPPDVKTIIPPSKTEDDHPEPEPPVDSKIDKPEPKDTRQIQVSDRGVRS